MSATGTEPEPAALRGENRSEDDVLIEVLRSAQDLGFIGPGSLDDHVRHGRAFAGAVERSWAAFRAPSAPPYPQRVVDLGSGGGLPALVIAVAWPGVRLTLIEAQTRRASFLRQAVDRLELGERLEVVEARAEVVGRDPLHRSAYEAVTARAFGRPAVTAECAAPLLEVGGVLVVSEPPGEMDGPERWPEGGLASLGMGAPQLRSGELHFAVIRQLDACPERYPRRDGVPAKRPLF